MHRNTFRFQLTNNRHLIENLPPFGKTQFTSDITSKLGYSGIVSNLRFLRSKTQLTSDLKLKVRI